LSEVLLSLVSGTSYRVSFLSMSPSRPEGSDLKTFGGMVSPSAAAAVVTRDSNSESPTCIGGGLGIRVGGSPELGGLFGLGVPRRFMGGRAGDEGDVSKKGR